MAPLPLSWTETQPGIHERALDGLEQFFDFISRAGQGRIERSNWCCFCGIKVDTARGVGFVPDVRRAWKELRLELPSLSALVQHGRWVYHSVVKQETWDAWLDETFHVHDVEASARQLFPLPDVAAPRRATLHVLPRTQEILLMAPHTHVDGLGMVLFMDQLMRLLVTAPPEHDTTIRREELNLMPSVTVTAGVPDAMTASQQEVYEQSLESSSQAPSIKLAVRNSRLPAQRTRLRSMSLSEPQTLTLTARCRELRLSITSVMQAALGRACKIQSQTSATAHCTMAIYDARSHIDPKYPSTRLVGSNIFAMPATFQHPPQSFVDSAKAAKAEFLRFTHDNVAGAASRRFGPDLIAALTSSSAGGDTPADLHHSSLGVVDKWLKTLYSHDQGGWADVCVRDFWVALDLLHPNILVDTWTFKGELTVEFIYNETFHAEETVSLLCALVVEQLTQGLQLDLGFVVRKPGQEQWL